jgi:hypothetical protein
MKIADILRRLADNIDARAPGATPDPGIQNTAHLAVVPSGQNVVGVVSNEVEKPSPNGTTPSGNDRDPEDLFLPPLQQKQELLKKAVGVENVYDDGGPEEQEQADEESEGEEDLSNVQQDIVDRIRQLSGVPTAAIQELSNDAVLDD